MTSGSPRRLCALLPERGSAGGLSHQVRRGRGVRANEQRKDRRKAWSREKSRELWDRGKPSLCELYPSKWKCKGHSVLTQPLLRSNISSHSPLLLCLLWILMAMRRAVKEEVIDCPSWLLFVLTLSCLEVWLPYARMSHEREQARLMSFMGRQRQSPIVIPAPQLPSGLSAHPAAFWNKGSHVFTDGLFRPCFPDLSVAPALTHSAGCIRCRSDPRLR